MHVNLEYDFTSTDNEYEFYYIKMVFCIPVFLPFLSHFIFVLKNIVCIFGMNPVVSLREKMREVTKIRKEMGVSLRFYLFSLFVCLFVCLLCVTLFS